MAPKFIFLLLIFSASRKLNDSSFLLYSRHIFRLQLVSFKIGSTDILLENLFQNFHSLVFLQISSGLGIVFKRFFAFEFYSLAYCFSMINLVFD